MKSPKGQNETHESQRLLASHRDLALALAAEHDLRRGVSSCLRFAIRESGLDCGGVYLVDRAKESIELLCHQGLSAPFVRSIVSFPRDSMQWRLISQGKPVYQHLFSNLGLPVPRAHRIEGLKAIAIVPIMHARKAIGCLNVASHVLEEVPPACKQRLELIAAEIGHAIARLQAEAALQQSEQRYRSLVENLAVGVFRTSVDPQGQFLQANKSLARIFRYPSLKELLANPVRDRYDDPGNRVGLLQKLRRHRLIDHELVRMRRKDGEIFWASLTAQGHFQGGRLAWVDGILEDVTERKAAADAVAQAHERLLHAREEERRRLAGELHDSLTQGLLALLLLIHNARNDAEHKLLPDDLVLRGMRRCEAVCKKLADETRSISRGLYPPELEAMGLISALQQLEQICQAARLKTTLKVSAEPSQRRLALEIEIALFRIAQEAVQNAIRHSGAERIRIFYTQREGYIRLAVRDDGCGFDPLTSGQERGLGLPSMRGRAQSLGAALKISRQAGWTEVAVRLPLSGQPG